MDCNIPWNQTGCLLDFICETGDYQYVPWTRIRIVNYCKKLTVN